MLPANGVYSIAGTDTNGPVDGMTCSGSGTLNGGNLTATLVSSENLPNTIYNGVLGIRWSVTLTVPGSTGFAQTSGTSSMNHLYVDNSAAAAGAYETVLDIGCRSASLLTDESQIVDAIWGVFSSDAVTEADGSLMRYNQKAGTAFGASRMIQIHRGQCSAWADLLYQVFAAQGIVSARVKINPPKQPQNYAQFGVNAIPAQGSGGLPYTAAAIFNYHVVVVFKDVPTRIYDPSYGTLAQGATYAAAQLQWQQNNVAGFYPNANSPIVPLAASNGARVTFVPVN